MKNEIFETLREAGKNAKTSATAVNMIIKSLCKEEQYMVDWCERINRSATHQLDWVRSVISKAKAEMQYMGSYNHKNEGF